MRKLRSIQLLIFLLSACGKPNNAAFISDHNRCQVNSTGISVSLVNPEEIDLPVNGSSDANVAQSFMLSESKLVQAFNMRLTPTTSSSVEISIRLLKELEQGKTASQGATLSLPNGNSAQLLGVGRIASELPLNTVNWTQVQLKEPIALMAATTYWIEVFTLSSGVTWTSIDGSGLAIKTGDTWSISSLKTGALTTVDCREGV